MAITGLCASRKSAAITGATRSWVWYSISQRLLGRIDGSSRLMLPQAETIDV
jgi:hypothetical protein